MNHFVMVEGKRYLMRGGLLIKLYWGRKKAKQCIKGFARSASIKSICKFCGKEFLHELHNPGIYCSRSCRAKYNNKSVLIKRKLKYLIVPGQYNLELRRVAQNRMAYLLNKTYIAHSENCSCCKQTGRIEGHHFNYYRPYEVMWLCVLCHRGLHFGQDINGIISNYNEIALKVWGNDIIEIAKVG